MSSQDFFGACAEVAVVTEDGGEFVRVFFGDGGDGSQKDGEADGEDALFAAREDAAAEVEGGQGSVFQGRGAEIVCDEADFFGFLGGGGDGFAELAEAEHGSEPVSHGVIKETAEEKIDVARGGGFADNALLKRFNINLDA